MNNLKDLVTDEVMLKLDAITRAEFELGWNLSEMNRLCRNDVNRYARHNVLARELQEELSDKLDDGYSISVSSLGFITLFKDVEEFGMKMKKTIDTMYSRNSKILPYAYVMGRKISKSAYLKTLELLK